MSRRRNSCLSRVYPRERGGTGTGAPPVAMKMGLSPQARGNEFQHEPFDEPDGSLPASAGERSTRRCQCSQTGVYPRERGGTAEAKLGADGLQGLSPQARGNVSHATRHPPGKVYPRKRGGTPCATKAVTAGLGLSPQARGNAAMSSVTGVDLGSIPASAGERVYGFGCGVPHRAYPRKRGGERPISTAS